MEETRIPNTGKKNLGVMISFIIILLVVSVVVIARFYPHIRKTQMQVVTQEKAMPPVANVMYQKMSPTPTIDTNNAQLDQDVQNAQGSLDSVDTNLNAADQANQ